MIVGDDDERDEVALEVLELVALVAPIVRAVPDKVRKRPVTYFSQETGKVTGRGVYEDTLQSLLVDNRIEVSTFPDADVKRPTVVPCRRCGASIPVRPRGIIPSLCAKGACEVKCINDGCNNKATMRGGKHRRCPSCTVAHHRQRMRDPGLREAQRLAVTRDRPIPCAECGATFKGKSRSLRCPPCRAAAIRAQTAAAYRRTHPAVSRAEKNLKIAASLRGRKLAPERRAKIAAINAARKRDTCSACGVALVDDNRRWGRCLECERSAGRKRQRKRRKLAKQRTAK